MLAETALLTLTLCTLLLSQIMFRVLIKCRKYKVTHSIVDNYFSLVITTDAILACAMLSLFTRNVDFECGNYCKRMLRFGSALKQLKQNTATELRFQSHFPAYLWLFEFGLYAASLYFLAKIVFFKNRKDLTPLAQEYAERFQISGDKYQFLKSVVCRPDPFISETDGEQLLLFDHMCPWTGRNICAQKMHSFLKFLTLIALATTLSLVRNLVALFRETQFVSNAFPQVSWFLISLATLSSFGGNQILICVQIFVCFIVLLVSMVQLIYQYAVKVRRVLPTELEIKVAKCQERVAQGQMFFIRTKEGSFSQFLQPYFKADQLDQQLHWEKSLAQHGQKLNSAYVDELADSLIRQRCKLTTKLNYLKSVQ